MTRRSCISAHVLLQGLPQIRNNSRQLIGSARAVPLAAQQVACLDLHLSGDGSQSARTFLQLMWEPWRSGLSVGDVTAEEVVDQLPCGVVMGLHRCPRLLDFTKTPPHLQFNKYVLTGYRPVSTAQDCLRSLFYMHNELGNIYSHGIPFLLFLVLLPYSIPWMEVDSTWICVAHYLACLCPTIGSVLYHVFMNHIGGEHVYDTLLSLDMVGVCLVNTLGALPIIYITLLCYPAVQRAAMLAYILLSGYGIYCATTAHTNFLRLRAFVWQALFRVSLFLFRVYGSGVGSPDSLRLFAIMDALAVLGGLVNVIQIPERFSPGLFDNWGNSHQIMHVMVVCSIVYLHWGTMEDLAWIKTFQCPAG